MRFGEEQHLLLKAADWFNLDSVPACGAIICVFLFLFFFPDNSLGVACSPVSCNRNGRTRQLETKRRRRSRTLRTDSAPLVRASAVRMSFSWFIRRCRLSVARIGAVVAVWSQPSVVVVPCHRWPCVFLKTKKGKKFKRISREKKQKIRNIESLESRGCNQLRFRRFDRFSVSVFHPIQSSIQVWFKRIDRRPVEFYSVTKNRRQVSGTRCASTAAKKKKRRKFGVCWGRGKCAFDEEGNLKRSIELKLSKWCSVFLNPKKVSQNAWTGRWIWLVFTFFESGAIF